MIQNKRENLLRMQEVRAMTGLQYDEIYSKIRSSEFPEPIKMGGRINVWPEQDIEAWIAKRNG